MLDVGKSVDKNKHPSLIILDGLKLSRADEKFFNQSLERLHGLIPLDTFVELNFNKEHGDEKILGKLLIMTYEHKFEATAVGINTNLIFSQLRENIYEQIREWYKDWPMTRAGQIYYSLLNESKTIH